MLWVGAVPTLRLRIPSRRHECFPSRTTAVEIGLSFHYSKWVPDARSGTESFAYARVKKKILFV
jgi:hypothetical protein